MQKKFLTIITLLTAIIVSSCKKESNKEYCWQVMDNLGNPVIVVCNKTEAEMQVDYSNSCSYYKTGVNYCWLIDNNSFVKDKPEDFIIRMKNCFGGYTSYQKVPCDYCQKWYTRQKHTYKPTGSFQYSPVYVQQYCGDTAQTLYQGRVIILRETPDSLITVQFSNNGVF